MAANRERTSTGSQNAGATPSGPVILSGVLLGWLLPGLGHWHAGLKRQGAFLTLLIGGAFAFGLFLSDCEAVSRDLHPIAFWAQVGVGGATIPLVNIDPAKGKVLENRDTIEKRELVPRHNDTGVLFCSIAGLLNVLALVDLVDRRTRPRPEVLL